MVVQRAGGNFFVMALFWNDKDEYYRRWVVNRGTSLNRAVLVAFCGLLASTHAWADLPQDDQFQTDQFQDDQPQPKHKKRVVHQVDPAAQLRRTMRDEINNGLLGIVSEGTDYTVDLALALTSEQSHLRLLPIAG